MIGLKSYKVRIDDLPEETIRALDDEDVAQKLSSIVSERDDLKNIDGLVNVAITRPDGSSTISTVGQYRRAVDEGSVLGRPGTT